MNWPGRRREEGGFEPIAHIRVIQVLPVADNWIDEDAEFGNSCSSLILFFTYLRLCLATATHNFKLVKNTHNCSI